MDWWIKILSQWEKARNWKEEGKQECKTEIKRGRERDKERNIKEGNTKVNRLDK